MLKRIMKYTMRRMRERKEKDLRIVCRLKVNLQFDWLQITSFINSSFNASFNFKMSYQSNNLSGL